ncbi:MAG: DUF3493 domain-containing protein [Leptolyngbyaceae cyanobacterium HOT.MB2.61]|jgi:hypothetical protein|nr:DUF3493 domain-containing protein [Leptolyngbyaceae cyanobacterium HOT.MB2.61]
MTEQSSGDRRSTPSKRLDDNRYARLKEETMAPYRGLRKFVYFAFAASGLIGAFIFLTQILAGRDVEAALPNLGLQIGIVALMVWLFRQEGRTRKK